MPARVFALLLPLLLAACVTPRAAKHPDYALVILHVQDEYALPRPDFGPSGLYRGSVRIVEHIHGRLPPGELVLELGMSGHPSRRGDYFALIEPGMNLIRWGVPVDVGLCGDPYLDELKASPGIVAAFAGLQRRFPCRDVPPLKLSTAAGLPVEIGSNWMTEEDVRAEGGRIAERIWADFCRRSTTKRCDAAAAYSMDMTLFHGYCLVSVTRRGDMGKPDPVFLQQGIYRCDMVLDPKVEAWY